MDSGMFKPLQLAAVSALNLGSDWFESLNTIYIERRKLVFEILDILKFEYSENQVGMFVWAKIFDKFKNAEEFSDILLEQDGVFITPGSVFGTNGERYIRISLCTDVERLKEARNIISQFVSKTNFIEKNEDYEMVHFKF